MKKISQLAPDAIPENDKFNFRPRASDLVTKWQAILTTKPEEGTANGAAPTATNGEPPAVDANGDISMIDGDITIMTDA